MLKQLQEAIEKAWTQNGYSEEFNKSPSKYKDFDHALKHVIKATAKLVSITEEADHDGVVVNLLDDAIKKYVADLVISTVRLANTCPLGKFDIEEAVRTRMLVKMDVRL